MIFNETARPTPYVPCRKVELPKTSVLRCRIVYTGRSLIMH